MRSPYVKSEPTSCVKVCCFCGYPGTNPVQCERCLVTRQTSGGMVYRKCNFCRQIGTSTQVCENCRRCPHCGNNVLPPNSVCQRCKTNSETFYFMVIEWSFRKGCRYVDLYIHVHIICWQQFIVDAVILLNHLLQYCCDYCIQGIIRPHFIFAHFTLVVSRQT